MRLAALLNVHSQPELVDSTIRSIRTHVTEDILAVVDKAGAGNFAGLSVPHMEGFWHDRNRSPYRNIALGLSRITGLFPDADWVVYAEYDTFFRNRDYRDVLAALPDDVWLAANDHRQASYNLPFLDTLLGGRGPTHLILGCCVFFRRDFLGRIEGFLTKLLNRTNGFQDDFPGAPGCVYDVAEVIFPTLAVRLGGRVHEFARWGPHWYGDPRFRMRFRPEIEESECGGASILHPVKTLDHPARLNAA